MHASGVHSNSKWVRVTSRYPTAARSNTRAYGPIMVTVVAASPSEAVPLLAEALALLALVSL